MKTKQCTKCKCVKPLLDFGSNKKSSDGLQWNCKECINRQNRARRPNATEVLPVNFKRCTLCNEVKNVDMFYGAKYKQSRCKACISKVNNKGKPVYKDGYSKCSCCNEIMPIGMFGKDSRNLSGVKSQCRVCRNKSTAKWKVKNKNKIAMYNKEWRKENKLNRVYRNILSKILTRVNEPKTRKTEKILGYGLREMKMRLECQFKPGMTWENYGDWEIDHKKPISRFISQGCTDPSIINALSNLQPLWRADNRAKGDKFNEQ